MRSVRFWSLVLALLASASRGVATTFVVPEDEQLIQRAEMIVTGRVLDTATRLVGEEVVTEIRIAPDEILKGGIAGGVIVVVESGGIFGDRGNWVYGTPIYAAGERVLVFLDRSKRNELKTSNMLLGKFQFVASRAGQRLLLRGSVDHGVFGLTEDGVEHQERPRLEDGFLAYVRGVVRNQPSAISYFADIQLQQEYETRLRARSSSHVAPTAYGMTYKGRYNNGAAKTIPTNLNGAPATRDWVGAAQRGAAAWTNDGGSTINYSVSGTTAAPFNQGDSSDVIVFNANPAEFGGAIGLGGWNSNGSHTFAGETWSTIAFIDVKISANASSTSQGIIDAIVCHELGHTLGFRHSNDGTPNSSDAVMNSVINRSGASLGSWDVEAASHMYGGGAPPACTPASVSGSPNAFPSTITAGQSSTLSVTGIGTAPLTYQWYRGNSGDTSSPAGNGQSINVSPSATSTYWVQVRNACSSGVNSSAATVTVGVPSCTRPAITQQPQPKTINAGQNATLTVSATGGGLSYQWYAAAGSSFVAVPGATSPTFVTPALGSTTSYLVQITNACGQTNSSVVTVAVTVRASCGAGNLCFHGGRFRVSLFATDPATGKTANGEIIPENDIFGYFSLPGLTNDPSNREVFVKVVGPVNGVYWVFFGGLTSFQYRLTVTDTATGQVKTYNKAPNAPNGGFDLGGGVPAESCPASAPPINRPSVSPSACAAGTNQLCLANRFIVRVFARDSASGLSGFRRSESDDRSLRLLQSRSIDQRSQQR